MIELEGRRADHFPAEVTCPTISNQVRKQQESEQRVNQTARGQRMEEDLWTAEGNFVPVPRPCCLSPVFSTSGISMKERT